MTARELLTTAMNGETPAITPLSIYAGFIDDRTSDSWRRILDQGLGICEHCYPVMVIEHGVQDGFEEREESGNRYEIHTKVTPVGTVRSVNTNGWTTEHWIKDPEDYVTMQWIVENTELVPRYEEYEKADVLVGDYGVPLVTGSRSPAMSINIDLAGTERFCLDTGLEVPELFDLYEAIKKCFIEETKLIAAGPGRFVAWFENLTISMMGPERYRELLAPVYKECVPILETAGKRVMIHYDGALSVIADQIAEAPFHAIESLTEPPEGDMTYDQCRASWPDKAFWANINVDCYYSPPEELRREVSAKRERAGKRALAFEISEDLPTNWEQSIPIVLDTLRELG